ANVVATDEEALEALRDLVDAVFQRLRPQVRAVAEDAALSVIARLDELHTFTGGQDFRASLAESSQILVGHESGAFVLPDEFFHRVLSVPRDGGKTFLGEGEDASAWLVREAVVEDPNFTRAGSEALEE